MFEGGVEQSSKLASLYQTLAAEFDCGFFNAGTVASASPIDGVHLDAENSKAIGQALAPLTADLLQLPNGS